MLVAVTSTALRTLRVSLRALQFVSCLTAMVLVALSYGYQGVYFGLYTSVSIFVYTMSYTAMLYALWCILVVETLQVANRLTARMEQAVDAALALLMLAAGVVLADSVDVSKCTIYGYFNVHCGTVKAALAFTFVGMLFFLASLAMTCFTTVQEQEATHAATEAPEAYHIEITAVTPPLSPTGDHDEPSFKV
ncbi:Molybdenum cofactor sulfurase [Phytophthora cinnamomi]|uniref:Molybdenum cofactor sulfurase n=1 Tax=Phytophthora cinnamomi TaxID=4785 RepID=UPI00355AAF95|nr:Molybdenum cofactor sulfurase [Phytophthora cinnamomi]